ncbi:lytic transglycosylase domain-containing protein [Meridianimarinicoccus sp. RP-17]|uniref:lytic transglycosylase domain-containing protein n=1 Tax=Meridianimarinicoccus zhengii TaxID=2056810 RepID=UPI001F432B8C|nr:lytic transglycosylase domain-containing protein [Phycocomes zhengii]
MTRDPSILSLLRRAMAGLILSAATAAPLLASAPDCEALAARAAAERGIPEGLLPSIARVESGRGQGKLGRRAWPWTLNQAGKGMYFDTRAEAMDYLRAAVARGVRNIDVGCMQINYRWHGDQFDSLESMMDPVANTRYAARFLSELRARHGSWEVATGHYHSMTPERGRHYRGLVARVLGDMPSPSELLARLENAASMPVPPSPDVPVTQVFQGLMPRGTGPLVALQGQAPGNAEPALSYMLAMSDTSALLHSVEPDIDAARHDARSRIATRVADPGWVRTQIETLRADFDRQSRQADATIP